MIRSITWLVRLLYLPLFLLVGNGVAIYLVAEGYNQGWLVFLILVFIGISFATEKLTPYDRAFNEPQQDQRRDLLHAFMNESLIVIGVAVLPLFGGLLVLAPIWPSGWPLAFQLLLAILLMRLPQMHCLLMILVWFRIRILGRRVTFLQISMKTGLLEVLILLNLKTQRQPLYSQLK